MQSQNTLKFPPFHEPLGVVFVVFKQILSDEFMKKRLDDDSHELLKSDHNSNAKPPFSQGMPVVLHRLPSVLHDFCTPFRQLETAKGQSFSLLCYRWC
jgi:hypothetical protein